MFRTVAAKALIGVSAMAALGGTTALAASPGATGATQKAVGAASPSANQKHALSRHGVVIHVTDGEMTIEREVRDKTTGVVTRDDTTFKVNAATRVFRAGSKDPAAHDALRAGERVRVSFAEKDGAKIARRVVIEPDLRAGKVLAKGDGYLVLHTREHGDVRVAVTDKTRYTTGHRHDGRDGSFGAIKVGDQVVAAGAEDSQHNFDGVSIRYNDPPARMPHPKKAK